MAKTMRTNTLYEAYLDLRRKMDRIEIALNPRLWPKELDEKWHKAIPDLYAVFEELRKFISI